MSKGIALLLVGSCRVSLRTPADATVVFTGRMQTVHTPQNSHTLRTDDLYVVYDLFPLDDLDLQGRSIPDLYDLYDLYDLAHVAGWEPHNLHDLGYVFPGFDLYYTHLAQHLQR